MLGRELRNEIRLPRAQLPSDLQNVTILSRGAEIQAMVVDASCGGLGLHVNRPSQDFITGSTVVLFPMGPEYPVYGQKVSVRPLTDSLTRVSIVLKEAGSYRRYRRLMEGLVLGDSRSTPYQVLNQF